MKQSKYLFSTVLVAALLSGGASDALAQKEITLLAPASSRRALDRILPNLEAETGYMVRVTYALARTCPSPKPHPKIARHEISMDCTIG